MLGIRKFRGVAVDLWLGDITTFVCDAMGNAANSELVGGAGVNGAIRQVGGPAIEEACQKLGHCEVGSAVVTVAGDLPCRYVIHAVGPRWQGGNHQEERLLTLAYHASLQAANRLAVRHVALPSLSTGIYGYPEDAAASVAMRACRGFIEQEKPSSLERITFVLFTDALYKHFQNALFSEFPDES